MRPFARFTASATVAIALATGAASALAMGAASPVAAGPRVPDAFCWVTGVDRNPGGVSIHLRDRRHVWVTIGNDSQSSRMIDPAAANPEGDWRTDAPTLNLPEGARFLMSNSPEDSCSGTVERRDGVLGVAMAASVVLPDFGEGIRIERQEKFLPAQYVDAHVIEKSGHGWELAVSWPAEAAEIAPLLRELETGAAEAEERLRRMAGENPAMANAREPGWPVTQQDVTSVMGDNALFLSLVTFTAIDSGGAHANYTYTDGLWERATSRRRDARELFTDGLAGLREPYCAALDAEREARNEGRWTAVPGGKYLDLWDCPGFDDVALIPVGARGRPFDHIRISAAPYVAGPWSDGAYHIRMAITPELLDRVKPEFRAAFALHGAADDAAEGVAQ